MMWKMSTGMHLHNTIAVLILAIVLCLSTVNCQATCPPLTAPNDGSISYGLAVETNGGYDIGDVATFSCDNNFILSGSTTSTCQSDYTWDNSEPTCQATCPSLTAPDDGSISYDLTVQTNGGYGVGAVATFSCDANFDLSGSTTSTCQGDHTWDNSEPTCQATCPSLTAPNDGSISYDLGVLTNGGYGVGAVATFSCDTNFDLLGSTTSTCQGDNTWDNSEPICQVSFGGETCADLSMFFAELACAPDGSYAPVQCRGMECDCVNTTTGDVLRQIPFPQRDTINCSAPAFVCPPSACGPTICSRGYMRDNNGCFTCVCEAVPEPIECRPVTELLEVLGCHCDCIDITMIAREVLETTAKDSCPTCNQSCNSTSMSAGSCVTRDSTCERRMELRIVGPYGTPECVQQPNEGDECMIPERNQDSTSGLNAQINIGQDMATCAEGSICVQIARGVYRCQIDNSPCALDRQMNPDIECDIEGNFMPLQCQPANTSMLCRCVDVTNGNTLSGTAEVRVEPGMPRPNCQPRDCNVPGSGNGRMFTVKHGASYFDVASCQSCQCNDGDPGALCSTSQNNCAALMSQNNCTLDSGLVLPHGEQMTIDCERCGCRNGQVRCVTIGDCERTSDEPVTLNMCQECAMLPPNPVCGPDGRNHRSECAAVNCAGLDAMELLNGACQSNDLCNVFPCPTACIVTGAVACIGTCQADQLRTCVNINTLQCAANESSIESQVCGSDGVTYSSTCTLLQTTVDVRIAHSGACENDECTSMGEVCGSDGVTYPNPCILRSQAVTRLDYPGTCITTGSTAEAICENVQTQGLCAVNNYNCDSPRLPKIGCCPVCGGAVTIAFDIDALTLVGSIDSDFLSFGFLASEVLKLFSEVPCTALIDITATSDIELSLISEDPAQSQECVALTEEIARAVNGENGKRRRRQTSVDLPQVFDYTLAADTAQLVPRQVTVAPVTTNAVDSSPTNPSSDGAMSVHVTLGALSLLVLSILSVLLG